jgi:hypothetical protein
MMMAPSRFPERPMTHQASFVLYSAHQSKPASTLL